MDLQRERLLTKMLEQPLEELLRHLDTNEVQVIWEYIDKVADKIIKKDLIEIWLNLNKYIRC